MQAIKPLKSYDLTYIDEHYQQKRRTIKAASLYIASRKLGAVKIISGYVRTPINK
jgi:hypothetical protein